MLPVEDRAAGVIPFLLRAGLVSEPVDQSAQRKIRRVVEACGDRLKLFSDILLYGAPFFRKDPVYEPKAVEKRLRKQGVAELLTAFRGVLVDAEPFEPHALEEKLRAFCESKQVGSGVLIHGLRVCTTGTEVGPGVFDCLAILGKDETLRRIDMGLKVSGQWSVVSVQKSV